MSRVGLDGPDADSLGVVAAAVKGWFGGHTGCRGLSTTLLLAVSDVGAGGRRGGGGRPIDGDTSPEGAGDI